MKHLQQATLNYYGDIIELIGTDFFVSAHEDYEFVIQESEGLNEEEIQFVQEMFNERIKQSEIIEDYIDPYEKNGVKRSDFY